MNRTVTTASDAILLNAVASFACALIENLGTKYFYKELINALNQLVPNDSAVVLGLRPGEKPRVIYDALHPAEESSFYNLYMGGAYLLSPLYHNWQNLRPGFYRMEDLGKECFDSSEFSEKYFKESGLCDEGNFVVQLSTDEAIAVSFGRQQLRISFSPNELQYMHVVEPMIRCAIKRHHVQETVPQKSDPDNREAHEQLLVKLDSFGKDILTNREQQVMSEILKGKSSKSAASVLKISPDTERGHRKSIYAKLGVTSQAELFSRVLESITDPAN